MHRIAASLSTVPLASLPALVAHADQTACDKIRAERW
jgi:hypothetical protein